MNSSILLIEDDPLHLEMLREAMEDNAYAVVAAADGQQAADALSKENFPVALIDICLPDVSGMDLLKLILERQPECTVLMMTGQASVEAAVTAMKEGAYDYLAKPFRTELLLLKLQRLFQLKQLQTENRALKQGNKRPGMVGDSAPLRRFIATAETVADTDATVLIEGESGTGKELAAEFIHSCSRRRNAPMVKVNCNTIPESLLESELFGIEKGAFTGADHRRAGYLEQAHEGTLFVDEIGELPHSMQVKLLRVLQEGNFSRLGSETPQTVDFRLIAATNRKIDELRQEGTIREDFFYRLNLIPLQLPSLRQRYDDIPLLIDYFIDQYAQRYTKDPIQMTPEALDILQRWAFPGNIRELENLIERLQVLYPGESITPRKLPEDFRQGGAKNGDVIQCFQTSLPLRQALRDFELRFIFRVLDEENGNRTKTAQRLGISRKALWEKLTDAGVSPR